MMIILDENESKIVKALLYYLAEKHNNYWDTDSEIDYDKEEYKNYYELRKRLEELNMINKNDDISKLLYRFLMDF
tara:strand:+ start:915 stop:1139 length:225 start_codon:yes stop_codon:yes gene_type:complete